MPSPLVKRSLWLVAAIVAIGCTAVVAVPLIASTRIVKDRIADEMGNWSGYKVSINAAPEIRFWPLRAVLTDVVLSEWGDGENKAVVESVRVEIDLSAWSALAGDVEFSAVRFSSPTLRIEGGQAGLYEFPFPEGGRIARSIEQARTAVAADRANPDLSAVMRDAFGSVSFTDARVTKLQPDGEVEIATKLAGELDWEALDRAGTLTASGVWRGEDIALTMSSPKPLVLLGGGNAPFSLSLKSAPLEASFDGTAGFAGQAFVDGQVRLTAPSLRRALDWSRSSFLPRSALGTASINAQVTGNLQRLKLENAQINLEGNPGMGALEMSLSENVQSIAGTLAFETLDIPNVMAALAPMTSPGGTDGSNVGSPSDALNVDLRLSAGRAVIGSVTLADVAATAQVKDGLSVFDVSDATAFGGNVQAGVRFDRKPDGRSMELRLHATDIDGGAFGAAVGMTRITPVGRGTVSVTLKSPGRSWASLLANGEGSLSASFGTGALAGVDLNAFMKRIEAGGFFALDEVDKGTLPMEALTFKATLSNGVARIQKAEARTSDRLIWLTGIVPYVGRGLALSGGVDPREPAQADAVGQQARFFVGGSWSAPFISPLPAPVLVPKD